MSPNRSQQLKTVSKASHLVLPWNKTLFLRDPQALCLSPFCWNIDCRLSVCPLLGETRQVLVLKKSGETYLSLMSNNGCNNPRRMQANKQTSTSGAEENTMCFIDDIPFCQTVFSNTQRHHGPMEIEWLPEPDRPEFKSCLCYHSGFVSLTVGIFRPITELAQIQSIKMTQWKINELNLSSSPS